MISAKFSTVGVCYHSIVVCARRLGVSEIKPVSAQNGGAMDP
jgi:hypothetical protein